MLPERYQTHLTTQLNKAQYLIISILVQLLQSYRWVRLEELANKFPQPILFESRRRKQSEIFGTSQSNFGNNLVSHLQRLVDPEMGNQ